MRSGFEAKIQLQSVFLWQKCYYTTEWCALLLSLVVVLGWLPSHSILHQQSSPVSGSMSPFAPPIQLLMGHRPLQPLSPFAFNVPLNFSHHQTPPLYGCSPSPYASCLPMSYSSLYQQQEYLPMTSLMTL